MRCEICEKKLKRSQGRFCSKTCQYQGFKGSGNPMFRDKKKTSGCRVCGKKIDYYEGTKQGLYCSAKCLYACPLWRRKQSECHKGKVASEETRKKMSEIKKGHKKSKEWVAKIVGTRKKYYDEVGRVTEEYILIKNSQKYNEWRGLVFARDGHRCQVCGEMVGNQIHHLVPFAVVFKECKILGLEKPLYDIENGIVICTPCHRKTDSFAKHWGATQEGSLIKAIEAYFEEEGSTGNFNDFYNTEIEKLINHYKNKIN